VACGTLHSNLSTRVRCFSNCAEVLGVLLHCVSDYVRRNQALTREGVVLQRDDMVSGERSGTAYEGAEAVG
jgi:hypothetical protein